MTIISLKLSVLLALLTLTLRDPRLKVKSAHFCPKQIKMEKSVNPNLRTNNVKYIKNLEKA